jgi:hypothetical protein
MRDQIIAALIAADLLGLYVKAREQWKEGSIKLSAEDEWRAQCCFNAAVAVADMAIAAGAKAKIDGQAAIDADKVNP